MNNPHSDLLADILAHCASTGMSKADFGKGALNDPRFVYDIESGRRQCLPRTVQRVRAFMADAAADRGAR